MKEKLDSEGLGIILITSFMELFFAKDKNSEDQPKKFVLCHYNGIKRSNDSNKVSAAIRLHANSTNVHAGICSDGAY